MPLATSWPRCAKVVATWRIPKTSLFPIHRSPSRKKWNSPTIPTSSRSIVSLFARQRRSLFTFYNNKFERRTFQSRPQRRHLPTPGVNMLRGGWHLETGVRNGCCCNGKVEIPFLNCEHSQRAGQRRRTSDRRTGGGHSGKAEEGLHQSCRYVSWEAHRASECPC
jgi:hypothetical protein